MEVRYDQETEGTGLGTGKEDADSHSSLSRSFLKEQQDAVSPSGTLEGCDKRRGSAGDPDYCRRILVRGRTAGTPDTRHVGEGGEGRTRRVHRAGDKVLLLEQKRRERTPSSLSPQKQKLQERQERQIQVPSRGSPEQQETSEMEVKKGLQRQIRLAVG